MERIKKQWENEELIMIGREEAVADFHHKAEHEKVLSLNGEWNFLYLKAPEYSPENFYEEDFEDREWKKIPVPSCWQFYGYGQKHYTDVWYLFPINPPFVPSDNPSGIYRRSFHLEKKEEGKQYLLRFDGVSSAFDVWVNGKHLGYSKVSRLGSSFDATAILREGENRICVRVYQWSDGSYLECQDMWWFSGIFREVNLISLPEKGMKDVTVYADYRYESGSGKLQLKVDLGIERSSLQEDDTLEEESGSQEDSSSITVLLKDQADTPLFRERVRFAKGEAGRLSVNFVKELETVHPWSAEDPYLYELEIALERDGAIVDAVTMPVGFRSIEVKGENFLVNGKAILLNGVNMHDFSPTGGLTVEKGDVEQDLLRMKRCNINAIRCSHYPKASWFYSLCDQYGFYVIDEADLETHGFEWIERYEWLNDLKSWEGAFCDRAVRMVKEHRNHPSIIMWSLGNESSVGQNFVKMAEAIRALDRSRLIHYESDAKADIADVYSTMYTRLDGMVRIAEGNDAHGKPHILCEYGHSMGNGPGNLREYQALFEKYPRLQGGFIWEWYDHGLKEIGKEGETVYCYGGDYGDEPNNGNFCIDGLLRPDKVMSSGLLNYKQVIAPLVLEMLNAAEGEFALRSKRYFRDSSDTVLEYRIWSGERTLLTGSLPELVVNAQSSTRFRISEIPELLKQQENKSFEKDAIYIDFRILYREESVFAKKGEELSAQQFVLKEEGYGGAERDYERENLGENKLFLAPAEKTEPVKSVETSEIAETSEICVEENNTALSFSNENFAIQFNKVSGKLEKLSYSGEDYITSGPVLNMLRANIDNDMYKVKDWKEKYFIHKQQEQLEGIRYREEAFGYSVLVNTHFSALSMAFGFKGEYSYKIYRDGSVELDLSMKGFRYSSFAPEFIPRIGVELSVPGKFSTVSWYGLGPEENYPDVQEHTRIGIYKKQIEEMHENYVMPQENGHREGTQWITLGNSEGSLQIVSTNPIGFDAHHYTIEALEEAKHLGEIRKSEDIILHLDAKHSGVGSNSCGEEQIYRNKTRFNDYRLQLLFQKIEQKEAFSAYRRARERSYE
ncbi:hypothetical protein HMPREF9624_01137 [Oribacterium asaccharolyticum ACB7]|uniref:Beta-galactosidase n=1 Tax=Oribacterium asaccharolyticum ACB7 TaxID=796944 RepID=G9WW53_9FIRM|nr:beta-galactosidase subunit alpha [Oribacterium asaccharolyticum]EHL10990.1 hypothetical protein HMPREF9624_01137 [Oribacterium asaccharolyticum ACB7]